MTPGGGVSRFPVLPRGERGAPTFQETSRSSSVPTDLWPEAGGVPGPEFHPDVTALAPLLYAEEAPQLRGDPSVLPASHRGIHSFPEGLRMECPEFVEKLNFRYELVQPFLT